ncbi:MAG: hypothetical protein DCC71_12085 [Proteobacteria bacterium]|nr:MAG: hypothetical protein DCC71_12085 [Pseudomonadota bacterium]
MRCVRRRLPALALAAVLPLTSCGWDLDASAPAPAPSVSSAPPTGLTAQVAAADAGRAREPVAAPLATAKQVTADATAADEPALPSGGGGATTALGGGASAPVVHERAVGSALVRFWPVRSVRTGRDVFEYHFEASIENRGTGLLRGALRVASSAAATRVVADCVPFGTTPPGTTRAGDARFAVAQQRRAAFDPQQLAFTLAPSDAGCADPGRVTLRRLNRTEYDHTVRDLLGTSLRPAVDFPADDSTYGFDTVAETLSLSPLLFEKLDVAAVKLVADALGAEPPSPQIAALRALCDPALESAPGCHRRMLAAFARRAWRRPPARDEVESLARVADRAVAAGHDFEAALADGMEAVLVSPHFVFRVERDPHARSAQAHPLGDHELAARLSYFLWASMPDPELDALADAGVLHEPATLAAQVARMIRDPKVQGFVESFGGQWLATRALDDVNPDVPYYYDWSDELREAMRQETHLFLRDLVRSEGSFLDLLDAEFTYANDRLAAHYGLPLPGTTELVRIDLAGHAERGGILTHGSVASAGSFPRRTSPVKRGKWILDQLLCIEIDPPPAGVEGFLTDPNRRTLREQLALHRSRPECASCHAYLDPLGLALEHYGPIGAYRTEVAAGAIDASGTLPDGRAFTDARELAALLKTDANTPRCIAERVLVYALGRGLGGDDARHVDAITAAFAAGGYRFESLLVALVQSPAFAMRRGQPDAGAP